MDFGGMIAAIIAALVAIAMPFMQDFLDFLNGVV